VWPLQCKWDLNVELEASSQAQCDCCVCVGDYLPVFSLSVSSPGEIDMPCQPVRVTIVSHFPPLSFPAPSELFSLALTGRVYRMGLGPVGPILAAVIMFWEEGKGTDLLLRMCYYTSQWSYWKTVASSGHSHPQSLSF